MKEIKVGLLGFGLSGRAFHAPIITSVNGMHLSKIFTRSAEKKEQAEMLYPETSIVDTVDSILEDSTIDLVVISLPNTAHYDMAERALKAGKHVVVEKPFTTTSAEAKRLIQISQQENKILSVYQNRRFDGDFLTLKQLIESKKLGNIKEFESHFDRFRATTNSNLWRESDLPGSGILFDLGAHLIDQALVLFGMPLEVYADIAAQRPNSLVDDHFEIIFYYETVKVTLKAGMLVKEPLPRYILLGDKGSYVKYGLDPQEAELKQNFKPEDWEDWGIEDSKLHGVLNIVENGLNFRGTIETLPGDYRKFYQNIYDAIVLGASLEVTADQAKDVIYLIEIAKESNKAKKRIVL